MEEQERDSIQYDSPGGSASVATIDEVNDWRQRETDRITRELRNQASKDLDEARKQLQDKLEADNREAISKAVESFKKEITPPTTEEIQKTLDDEYIEFTIKLKIGALTRTFVIHELSAFDERHLVRLIKEKLAPHLRAISGILLELSAGDWESRLLSLVDTFEPALEVVHEVVAYILLKSESTEINPSDSKVVTAELVRQNVSLTRQMRIVQAQIEANRVRDFLSGVSRLAARLP